MLGSNERYIVRKSGKYLVGCPYDKESNVRYSDSKYDGYRMNDFNDARDVAKIVGGKVMKLNLLTGRIEGGWA